MSPIRLPRPSLGGLPDERFQFTAHADDRRFWEALGTYLTLLSCLLDLALDPVRDALAALYAHRSGTERENASTDSYQLDRRHRNAPVMGATKRNCSKPPPPKSFQSTRP